MASQVVRSDTELKLDALDTETHRRRPRSPTKKIRLKLYYIERKTEIKQKGRNLNISGCMLEFNHSFLVAWTQLQGENRFIRKKKIILHYLDGIMFHFACTAVILLLLIRNNT